MSRLLLMALIAVLVSGPAWGKKGGKYDVIDTIGCGAYLDAYSRSKITLKKYNGPREMWKAIGYVNGYLTAYKTWVENDKLDILGSMSERDAFRWLASWCRDNPSRDLHRGLNALVRKLNR